MRRGGSFSPEKPSGAPVGPTPKPPPSGAYVSSLPEARMNVPMPKVKPPKRPPEPIGEYMGEHYGFSSQHHPLTPMVQRPPEALPVEIPEVELREIEQEAMDEAVIIGKEIVSTRKKYGIDTGLVDVGLVQGIARLLVKRVLLPRLKAAINSRL